MNKIQLGIVYNSFPRSAMLGIVAIPATYMLGNISPVTSFILVWGVLFGLALGAQLYNIYNVVQDVHALIMEVSPESGLAGVARIALRRTFTPIVLMSALAVWVLDSTLTGAILSIRATSEWLLYYLISVLVINAGFDLFDRHKMLTMKQIHMQVNT